MRRETVRSLPGMARAESTTVSPGPDGHVAVLADADQRQGRERLALAPRDEHDGAVAGAARPRRRRRSRARLGNAQQAEVEGHLGVVDHAAADEGDGPAGRGRDVGHALHARDRGGEAGDEHAARASGRGPPRTPARRRPRPAVRPGCSTLVLSERRARTPRSPHADERLEVGALVGRGLGVDLEVAARDARPRPASRWRGRGCRGRCARRGSGARGRGRSRPAGPGRACAGPRRRRAPGAACGRSRGSARLPYTGAGAACRAKERAPMWSSWPWVSRMPRRRPGRSARYSKSGTIESTPGISAAGNSMPASRSRRCSSHSSTSAFRPNSPRPPSGTRRIGFVSRVFGSNQTPRPRRTGSYGCPERRELHNR